MVATIGGRRIIAAALVGQLAVSDGMRVEVLLGPENVRFGSGELYPQGGIGTVSLRDEADKIAAGTEKIVRVILDRPFFKKELVFDKILKRRVLVSIPHMELNIPTWLLQKKA